MLQQFLARAYRSARTVHLNPLAWHRFDRSVGLSVGAQLVEQVPASWRKAHDLTGGEGAIDIAGEGGHVRLVEGHPEAHLGPKQPTGPCCGINKCPKLPLDAE